MNTILEEKMKDLMSVAEQQGAGAAYAVLHMLLGSYHHGIHNKFAKHCCEFSSISFQMMTDISGTMDEFAADEFARDSRSTYYH
ncbi:MAG: hypothetical protein ACREBD_17350 [Blastocatellia bacterium]